MEYYFSAEECSSQNYGQSYIASFTKYYINTIVEKPKKRLKTSTYKQKKIRNVFELRFSITFSTIFSGRNRNKAQCIGKV